MSKKAFMDLLYHVGMGGDHPLTVSPDPDNPADFVRVYAADTAAREFWGKVDFTLDAQMARKLAAALIAVADHCEAIV